MRKPQLKSPSKSKIIKLNLLAYMKFHEKYKYEKAGS